MTLVYVITRLWKRSSRSLVLRQMPHSGKRHSNIYVTSIGQIIYITIRMTFGTSHSYLQKTRTELVWNG